MNNDLRNNNEALEELDSFYEDCARINLIKFGLWEAGTNERGGDARC